LRRRNGAAVEGTGCENTCPVAKPGLSIYEMRGALPDVKQRMAVLGFEPVAKMPGEFAARIEAEVPKWGKLSATLYQSRAVIG
jgi:hypothetical protein